jgi:hypothetical protein
MSESVGSVASVDGYRTLMPAQAGGARRRITFFACAKKVTKESTPRFAALRVPNFSANVRAAAQLGLRPQTVLADCPRTFAEKLAARRGYEHPTRSRAAVPTRKSPWGTHPSPLKGEGLGVRGRRQQVSRKGPSNSLTISPHRIAYATPFPSPLREPRLRGEAGGSRRKLSERSEFFRRPASSRSLGVSTEGGVLSLVTFLCTSKESNVPPGTPGQRRPQY